MVCVLPVLDTVFFDRDACEMAVLLMEVSTKDATMSCGKQSVQYHRNDLPIVSLSLCRKSSPFTSLLRFNVVLTLY